MTDPVERAWAAKVLTTSDAAKSLRKIADEHEEFAGLATSPSEAGYHMARMLVMRTAADLLDPPVAEPRTAPAHGRSEASQGQQS